VAPARSKPIGDGKGGVSKPVGGTPAVKPANTRPIGSKATLNGKPVTWDGKTWKPTAKR
jgi:hypothetical protein